MVWYGMAWKGMVWKGMEWHGMAWKGVERYGMVWNGTARQGTAWHGTARQGRAGHGTARHGMVWYGNAFKRQLSILLLKKVENTLSLKWLVLAEINARLTQLPIASSIVLPSLASSPRRSSNPACANNLSAACISTLRAVLSNPSISVNATHAAHTEGIVKCCTATLYAFNAACCILQ